MKILKIIARRKFIAFWFIIEDNVVLNIILFNMCNSNIIMNLWMKVVVLLNR